MTTGSAAGLASPEVVLLANPTARKGAGLRALDATLERLTQRALRPTVVTGRDAEESLALALHHAERGVGAIVAVGGDGTANLAAQAAVAYDVPLAVLPVGTGNDFAYALDLPADPGAVAALVAGGRTRTLDVGRTGERVWLTIAAMGFDSRVNERSNALTWPRGQARYDVAIAFELLRMQPIRFRMVADGLEREFQASFVSIGNTRRYGGGFDVCPHAEPDDGLLDVTVVGPMSRATFVRLLPLVQRSPAMEHPLVARFRARRVTVEALGRDAGLHAYADGDPVADLPATFEVVPGAMRLLVP